MLLANPYGRALHRRHGHLAPLALLLLALPAPVAAQIGGNGPTGPLPPNFVSGLTAIGTNPVVGNDPNDRRLVDIGCTTDSTTSNPSFSNENCLQITLNARNGQNSYAGGTNAKKTFLPLAITGNMTGAGQRFLLSEVQNCWGMGDCFGETRRITFAGANIAGDEGQGFQSVSYLQQQSRLVRTTIASAPVRTRCDTTLARDVTASRLPQTVMVADATGCKVGDWVVVGEESPTSRPNHEALRVIAVGGGTVTAIFRNNHRRGATSTPALVLRLASTSMFGQGRILIDLSGASHSTGGISAVSGGALIGTGTKWTTDLVGGNAANIGCIALAADDYAGAPFTGSDGPIRSWYQIKAVSSPTSLGIYKTSVAGDAAYHGKGPGSGAYTIRPCAEVLLIDGNEVVLETSTAAWSQGDSVELSISPYPDVSGWQNYFAVYTPGGTLRRGLELWNTGARTFQNAIEISANMPKGADVDPVGWRTGISISHASTGLSIDGTPTTGSIALSNGSLGAGLIRWGPYTAPNYNQFIGAADGRLMLHGLNGPGLASDPGALTISQPTYPIAWANFTGLLALDAIPADNTATRLRFYDQANTRGDPQTATRYVDIRYAYPGAGGYHGLAMTGSESAAPLLQLDFGNQQTTVGGALEVGAPEGGMPRPGMINAQGIQVNGAALSATLFGATGIIGGSPLDAGQCASGTAPIPHSNNSMAVVTTPQTYPGDGFLWNGYVSARGTVTIKICAIVAGTPKATAYNVRVLQ